MGEAERFLALRLGRLPFEKRATRRGGVKGKGEDDGRGGRVEARRFVSEGRELGWLAEAVAADVRRGACGGRLVCVRGCF